MTAWLKTRKAGIEVIPNPNDPTSVLRPSRATTVGEKQEMKRRKMQNKGQDGKEKKMKRDLQDLQAHAAAEGCATHCPRCPFDPGISGAESGAGLRRMALKEQMNMSRARRAESLTNVMGDASYRYVSAQCASVFSAGSRAALMACRRTPRRPVSEEEEPPMNAPHGSLGKGYSAAGNMVSPGNFAPVSVVGTGNLAHVSQTPVEQPEETVPQYSETPTPFYLNQVRNRSPGKSPAEWLAGAAMNSSTFQSWPGPDHSTSPVAPGSASHSGIRESDLVAGDGSHLVGLSPLQSIAHVSNNQATNHRGSPAAANISPPDQATAAAMQMQSRSPAPAAMAPPMAAPSSTDHEAAAAAGHSPADTSARSETTEVSLMGDISPDVSSKPLPSRYLCYDRIEVSLEQH